MASGYGALDGGPSTNDVVSKLDARPATMSGGKRFRDPVVEKRGYIMQWGVMFETLLRKNLALLWHKKIFTLTMVLFPSMFVLLLWWLSTAIGTHSYAPVDIAMTKCRIFDSYNNPMSSNSPCITLMYAPDTPATEAVFKKFSVDQGLVWGTDVVAASSREAVAGYLFDNVGMVDTALVFTTENNFTTADVHYDIWCNASRFEAYARLGDDPLYSEQGMHGRLAGLQKGVDAAIMSYLAYLNGFENTDVDLGVSLGIFKEVDNNNLFNAAAANVVQISAPVMLVCGITVVGLMVLNIVTTEKHNKLLGALRTVGISEAAHWASWFAVFVVTSMIIGLVTASFGSLSQVSLFTQCDWSIHVVAFFLFACSFSALCIWIGSFVTRPMWVNIASFLLFSVSTVITFTLTTLFDLDEFYNPSMTTIVQILMFFQPWFHYAKVIHNILDATAVTQVGKHGVAVHTYDWADVAKKINPNMGGATTWYAPSAGYSMWMMFVLCIVYLVLAWYFGQLFAGDLGASQRFWFPFTPQYWGFGAREEILPGDTLAIEQNASFQDQSVRLHKLSKAYDKTTALKEVSMAMAKGECLALLGQNGAGKTTLVNVVSGLLSPTHGHAFIFGKSVTEDLAALRSIMGRCPQHDLLWLELSARQHLRIYARLKGVARRDVEQHVTERLAAVNLQDDGDVPVKGFSGGMKRRLSVAISSMGSPQLIVLDEPSTGMDPLSKRRTWQLIEDLKIGRVVLLTTHSMEEADALGDQIAILAQGRLRAKGTSLFLKNRFGAGYQISLLAQPELVGDLKALVADMLPDAEIVGDNAANITVALPRHATAHVPNFLRELNRGSSRMVKEWGLSNSTLEEVFLRLAVQAQGVNEATEPVAVSQVTGVAGRARGICTLCQARPTENVVLYTSKGVTVEAPDLICGQCAQLEIAEADALRNPAAAVIDNGDGESKAAFAGGVPQTAEIEAKHDDQSSKGLTSAAAEASDHASPKRDSSKRGSMSAEVTNTRQADLNPISVWHQMLAVLMMRGQMQAKQRKTNCCYVVFIVVIVLVTYLLEPSVSHSDVCPGGWEKLQALRQQDDDQGENFNLPSFNNCNRSLVIEFMSANPTHSSQNNNQKGIQYTQFDSLQNNYVPPYYGQFDFPNWDQNQAVNYQTNSQPMQVWYQDASSAGSLPLKEWNLLGIGKGNLTATEIISFTPPPQGVDDIPATVSAAQSIVEAHTGSLTCGEYAYQDGWTFPSEQAASGFMRAHFPDFSITMQTSRPKPTKTPTGHSVDVQYQLYMYQPNGFYNNAAAWFSYNGTPGYPEPPQCMEIWVGGDFEGPWKNGLQPQGTNLMQAVNGFNNGILNTMLGNDSPNALWIHTRIATMVPFKYPVPVGQSAVITQAFLFPMFTMFLLPAFVAAVVVEKETRLYQMMRMEGMKAAAYWAGCYLFNMAYFIAIAGTYVASGYLFSIASVTHASPFLFVAVLGLWAHSQTGLAFFMASLFPRARLASIVSYMIVVLVAITTGVLVVQGLDPWPSALLWVTPLGYARAIVLVLAYGGSSIEPGSELQTALLILFVTGTLELVAGMYLHAVLPDKDGMRSSPLFFTRWCYRPKAAVTTADASVPFLNPNTEEDVDVVAERQRVFNARNDARNGISIRGLVKTFKRAGHAPKHAVRGVTFGAEYGSCTGLLGPNGAGKTTTISMLTGSLLRTAGVASIGGYDTGTEMDLVYRILGVCPQFDCVWDDLTVAEHLLFYVRLRGIHGHAARVRVQQTAEKVNLDGDEFNMKASELSGGMKRRLSLGIALCGNPMVVLADEPSTGLDPDTRRQVWDIISAEASSGKCILLTTHSMEEADTLCNKIAIMAHGRLRCIGNQLHLKNRFGEGYKLSLILRDEGPPAWRAADVFVADHVSRIARRTPGTVGNSVTYVLPRNGVDVAALFQILEARKTEGGIKEWGLTQCSLEEVFIKVVTQAEDEEAAAEAAKVLQGQLEADAHAPLMQGHESSQV